MRSSFLLCAHSDGGGGTRVSSDKMEYNSNDPLQGFHIYIFFAAIIVVVLCLLVVAAGI